ncbi:MAG: Fe-S cluster assembly protein IscX [Gammaproteobacteria bacterium]|nr:Fe-S cluster assembly protein IscX [Gammaproteobacteria bacterium]
MGLKWIDSQQLAEALAEAHPDIDPRQLHFPQLMQWVLALAEFDDEPGHCGELVLEAIQQAWIDEAD